MKIAKVNITKKLLKVPVEEKLKFFNSMYLALNTDGVKSVRIKLEKGEIVADVES